MNNDSMFDILSISHNNAMNGIGPKTKKKQTSILDVVGEKELEIFGEDKKQIDNKKYLKTGSVSWNKLHISRGITALQKPIEEWTSEQFFIFFVRAYESKYPQSCINTSYPSGIAFMKKLKQDFKDNNCESTSDFIKKYLEWFIRNELDSLVAQKGKFVLQDLRSRKAIRRFNNECKIESDSIKIKETVDIKEKIAYKNMDLIFKASRINFIMKYGIITTVNWLIYSKKMTEQEAQEIVMAILKDTIKEGKTSVDKIVFTTKDFSPYPIEYDRKCLIELFNFIKFDISNIKFCSSVKSYV